MFWLNCFRLKTADLNEMTDCEIFWNYANLKKNTGENVIFAQRFKFTNRNVFSCRCTNFFSCFFFRAPFWPCGSSCRGGVTRKDAHPLDNLVINSIYFCTRIILLKMNSKHFRKPMLTLEVSGYKYALICGTHMCFHHQNIIKKT